MCRFSAVMASVIEVKAGGPITNMVDAVIEAINNIAATASANTVNNIVFITDRPFSDIGNAAEIASFRQRVTAGKNAGIKFSVIHGDPSRDPATPDPPGRQWEEMASHSNFSFYGSDFTDKLSAWNIQKSLCQGKPALILMSGTIMF